jgi:hypothetical protein
VGIVSLEGHSLPGIRPFETAQFVSGNTDLLLSSRCWKDVVSGDRWTVIGKTDH